MRTLRDGRWTVLPGPHVEMMTVVLFFGFLCSSSRSGVCTTNTGFIAQLDLTLYESNSPYLVMIVMSQ